MAHRRLRRGGLGIALALTLVLGAPGCGSDATSSAEQQKAAELQEAVAPLDIDLEADTAIALYGDDGGKLCAIAEDPAALEREGLLAHPRFPLRRLHVTTDAVAYTKAVITVYCPDQLGNVESYIEGLRVADEN